MKEVYHIRKLCCLVGIGATALIFMFSFRYQTRGVVYPPSTKVFRNSSGQASEKGPWEGIPDFILYLRFTSGQRWEREYHNVLIRTMKIFMPRERAKLLVVLDNEKPQDHKLGDKLKQEWPNPEVCYRDPWYPDIYHRWGKSRMFWDMMHPDHCTNVPYVGFIDTDTFFSTVVTPNQLFENGKPVIVAKIGLAPYPCWEVTTETFIGRKEVMQCMSTFPVMIKTEHMKLMREVLAKEQGKAFQAIFRDSTIKAGGAHCLCQFSIMCNYVRYYHRDKYAWHLQMQPDGNWDGKSWMPSQVPVQYYHTEVEPEMKIPIPRTSIHYRYTIVNGKSYVSQEPPPTVGEDFIREGLCYSAGFDYCPAECRKWNKSKIHYNLYSFEYYQWFWDKRCMAEQIKHYERVRKMVDYYVRNKIKVFNVEHVTEICNLINDTKLII